MKNYLKYIIGFILFFLAASTAYAAVTFPVNGGTGQSTFNQGWIYTPGGTQQLNSSTSPTVRFIVATSTIASQLPYASTTDISAETASTTNLRVSGITAGQCLHVVAGGVVAGTGSDCSAGGGGGGTDHWATTTNNIAIYPSGGAMTAIAVGGISTSTAFFQVDPNLQTLQIGNAIVPQLDGFGTKYYEFQTSCNVADVCGGNIWNTSTAATAADGLFFGNNLTPTGGIGALGKYYAGFAFAGSNWNGIPLGLGALPANGFVLYNTDGNVVIGAATSTGNIDSYVGAGSFAGGVPDMRLASNGYLGIATSSPYAPLSVVGVGGVVSPNYFATSTTATSTFSGILTVGTSTGITSQASELTLQNTNNKTFIVQAFSTAGVSQFTMSNAGNFVAGGNISNSTVQIGSSDIRGVGTVTLTIGNTAQASAGGNTVINGSNSVDGILTLKSTAGAGTSDQVRLRTGNNGAIIAQTILSNGNTGFATTTPQWGLQVATTSVNQGPKPQFTLTDMGAGVNLKHWSLESQAGNFYISTSSDTTFATSSTAAMILDKNGHVDFPAAGTPSLSSCGSSPSVVGNDNRFTITVGGTATGCTVTFSKAFTTTPVCNPTLQTTSVVNAMTYTKSTTAITISQTGLSGDLIDVICFGN